MSLILSIGVAIVMAVIANKKGFNPFLWILAGGILGFLILIFMPSANAEEIDEATRTVRRKRGNVTGGVISCIAIVLIIGFIAWSLSL